MSFNFSEITFPSADGIHKIHAEIYTPRTKTALGVVQLAHGMTDYVGRYHALAEYLTERGFVFAGHAHLGHGKSAASPEELGFFAERGGADLVVEDMRRMNDVISETFPNLPIVVMGHSMGSFIARLFVAKYPHAASGLIIHATGGPSKIVTLGSGLVKVMSIFLGKRHRSPMMRRLASRGYNKKFPKEEGRNAWLTRDKTIAEAKLDDPLANFTFTLSAYADLFRLVKRSNSKRWFDAYPKFMPTLIVSGDADPVGGWGRGVGRVYKELLLRDHSALTMKIYEGARHELFNEINREEVFSDLYHWLLEVAR